MQFVPGFGSGPEPGSALEIFSVPYRAIFFRVTGLDWTQESSQLQDWKTCMHGEVTRASQYQWQSCAIVSRVVYGGLKIYFHI